MICAPRSEADDAPASLRCGGCPVPVRATLVPARSSFAGECQPDPRSPDGHGEPQAPQQCSHACTFPARSTAPARAAGMANSRVTRLVAGHIPRARRSSASPRPTRMRARPGLTTRGAARNALASSASRRATFSRVQHGSNAPSRRAQPRRKRGSSTSSTSRNPGSLSGAIQTAAGDRHCSVNDDANTSAGSDLTSSHLSIPVTSNSRCTEGGPCTITRR